MKTLPNMVLRKTLFVGVLPALFMSLAVLALLARHGVLDATREADFEASRSKASLDHTIQVVASKWIHWLRQVSGCRN